MAEPDPRERFTALYDTHHPRVHAYAVSRTGRQLAEEVTSETFCVAWRRFGDLPDPPLPWLLGIARGVVRSGSGAARRFKPGTVTSSLVLLGVGWTNTPPSKP